MKVSHGTTTRKQVGEEAIKYMAMVKVLDGFIGTLPVDNCHFPFQ